MSTLMCSLCACPRVKVWKWLSSTSLIITKFTFPSGCISFHFCKSLIKVSSFSLCWVTPGMNQLLIFRAWNVVIVVLICILQIPSEVEHLFTCLLGFHVRDLSIHIYFPLSIMLSSYCFVGIRCRFWIVTLLLFKSCKTFSPSAIVF